VNLDDNKTSFILLIGKTQERIKNLVITVGFEQRSELLKNKDHEGFMKIAEKQLQIINRKCEEISSITKHCLHISNNRFDELICIENEQDQYLVNQQIKKDKFDRLSSQQGISKATLEEMAKYINILKDTLPFFHKE
jgi:hypothetical protein